MRGVESENAPTRLIGRWRRNSKYSKIGEFSDAKGCMMEALSRRPTATSRRRPARSTMRSGPPCARSRASLEDAAAPRCRRLGRRTAKTAHGCNLRTAGCAAAAGVGSSVTTSVANVVRRICVGALSSLTATGAVGTALGTGTWHTAAACAFHGNVGLTDHWPLSESFMKICQFSC